MHIVSAALAAILLQDMAAQPPPSSCRAGAVVHMLHANNSRVPVTLQIIQHDDGAYMQHVIKVGSGCSLMSHSVSICLLGLNLPRCASP